MSLPDRLKPVWFIARREMRDQLRDWRVIFPIAGLTLLFPFLMNFTARTALNFVAKYGATLVADRLSPFLLMIVGFFPISVSLVIALDIFVGEKERGSIEPLLNTPVEDWQLYLGKLVSSTIPPLVSSYIGMAVYILGLVITHVTLPEPAVMVQLVALTTVQAVAMVAGAVIVSSQTTSARAANLLASFIVIPAALLIQGESMVLFWGDYSTLWWVVIGMIVMTILLVRVGLAHFRREELLGREIDILNIRWGWQMFRHQFTGGAVTFGQWYRGVLVSVKELRTPMLILIVVLIAAVGVGFQQVERFPVPMQDLNLSTLGKNFGEMTEIWPLLDFKPVMSLFWQNLRVLLLALPLGLISFGVIGVLPAFASLAVVGYLMGVLQAAGITPWAFMLGFIIPHGIFEIPALVIATAAILHLGAAMATFDPVKSVSEVLLQLLAEWSKIMVGVVIPLLLIAAMVEAWITPRIALGVLNL